MNRTLTRTALALALGLLPLAAQTPAPTQKPRQGFARMAEQLKLSDEQKAKIQAIQQTHRIASTPKLQAAAEARKALRDALRKPETPAAQLKSLHQAKSEKEFELLLDRRALTGEIRAVLTPEQRSQWDQQKAYREARKAYGEGHARGKGGRGKRR